MTSLSPSEASHIVLQVIQHLRKATNAGPNFTLANLATLLAVFENPGALQPDIGVAVGGVDGATLTRHLNMLGGMKRLDASTTMLPLVRTERNVLNRRLNDVFLTPEGEKLASEFATHFSRLLTRSTK